MLEFWELDDDPYLGFVVVDREFELWLIASLGISFEDISYATLGEEEEKVELIMDYGDFINLQDLYEEYTMYGWSILTDEEDVIEDWQETFALRAEGLFGSETPATQRIQQRGYNPRRYEKKSIQSPSYYRHKVRSEMSRDIAAAITPAQVVGIGALLFLGMLMFRKK